MMNWPGLNGVFFYDSLGWESERAWGILNTNQRGVGYIATQCRAYDRESGFSGGILSRNCEL